MRLPVKNWARSAATAWKARSGFICACAVLALVYVTHALTPLDNGLAALRAQLVQRAPSHDLVVVEIDSDSLRSLGDWPWSRERFARAILNLRAAGAKIIGFDVDFSARSTASDDAALRAAIDADSGSVVLPTFLQRGGRDRNSPLASLAGDASFASVNVPIDADGKVRRYLRGVDDGERHYASIGSVLADAPYRQTGEFMLDYGTRVSEIDRLSFIDVLNNRFAPERVRGKTILVGATALELGDNFSTPVHAVLPGVYVHALAFENIRQNRSLLELNGLVPFVLGLATLVFLWPRKQSKPLHAIAWRHCLTAVEALLVPVALQTVYPVSIDFGPVIAAQALCFWATVHHELARREREIATQREAHLAHVALHDPETQLPNRRAMLKEVGDRIGTETSGMLVVAAIGIDRFAVVRGAIGYTGANELVCKVAQRLAEWSGEATVYHLSTSILGIILSAEGESEARIRFIQRFARLNTAVEMSAGHEIDATVRAGLAVGASGSADKLLEEASLALDLARSEHRRCVFFAQEQFDAADQLSMFSSVGNGLDRGEFSLHFQPKVSARHGQLEGAEALMRWHHPTRGDIPPSRFIPVAEETGAIDALTRWALRRAIDDQAALRLRGVRIPLSVNISGRSLCDREFIALAIDLVASAQADICFEVTETAIIQDPELALEMIAALTREGILVSIDDYGTGFASLSYLKQISAQELKLDRSLIQNVDASSRERLILKSTIDLAHSIGLKVVAEGVEESLTRDFLVAMGCDTIQGYLISRPLTLDGLFAFAKANKLSFADDALLGSYSEAGTDALRRGRSV